MRISRVCCRTKPTTVYQGSGQVFHGLLETDFHKQRCSEEVVRLKDLNSLLVGINLRKYPSFHQKIPYLISKVFANSLAMRFQEGLTGPKIPRNLLELVRQESEQISDESILRMSLPLQPRLACRDCSCQGVRPGTDTGHRRDRKRISGNCNPTHRSS